MVKQIQYRGNEVMGSTGQQNMKSLIEEWWNIPLQPGEPDPELKLVGFIVSFSLY